MEKIVYQSTCEWDIGPLGVFEDLADLIEEQKVALKNVGVDDPFDELVQEGLVGFEKVTLTTQGEQLDKLRAANIARQEIWPGSPSMLFRAVEFGGEAGEVLDAVKKLARFDTGIKGNSVGTERESLMQGIREEVGDALVSLDLLCEKLGIDIAECVPMKFNKSSRKVGIPLFMNSDWDVERGDGSSAP